MFRIILQNIEVIHGDRLVAQDAGRAVDGGGIDTSSVYFAFGAGDKVRAGLMHFVKSGKVQIAAIHHVEDTGFDGQEVQHVDLLHLALADMKEGRSGAAQMQQGVHFHRRLCRLKWCPAEQRQEQVDCRRIDCVNRVDQIQTKVHVAVRFARPTNMHSCKLGSDAPIPRLVRIGQGRTGNIVAQSYCVQLATVGGRRHFDFAQGFAPRQLSKRHHSKLFCARQSSYAEIAGTTIHDTTKIRLRHKLHDLCEKRIAYIHSVASRVSTLRSYTKIKRQDSNRHQIKSAEKPRQY